MSVRPAPKKKPRAKSSPPVFVEPCLASLVREPPRGEQWVHEIKFDGYRLQALIEGGSARLMTRRGLDWTHRFASLAKALADLKVKSAGIDGEVVVEDAQGHSDFVRLVAELKAGRSAAMLFYAFDLLHLNGRDVRPLPLLERKSLLQTLLASAAPDGPIRYSQHIEREGPAMLHEVCKLGLEGIVSKRGDKPYRSGRGEDWLKSKCLQSDEFVIGGYVKSTAMKEAVGALLLGYYEGKAFHYAGRVGTGFSHKTARSLWQVLQPLRKPASPYAAALSALQRRGVTWVKPKLVAQVDYRATTADNLLRHASFKSLREDKLAREVNRPVMLR